MIDEIDAVFHVKDRPNMIYAWGDRIYNPSGNPIPPSLIAHERVHLSQHGQPPFEEAIRQWWMLYLADPGFRFSQELPAHRAEYQKYCADHKSREQRNWMLRQIASRLAGPIYGKLVTFSEAMRAIK